MPNLKVFLLGPPTLELDGQPVEIKRRKALALLAYLAATDQAHTRDEVATLFWPDYEPAQSYAYLRRALWELNNTLGKGWLNAGREQVGLSRDDSLWLDVSAFLDGVKFERQEPADSLARLVAAASLYRGEFMAGFTLRDAPEFDMWQRFSAEHLRQQLTLALERLVIGYENQGEFKLALEYAQRWLTLDALHEPAHQALMRLYASSGRRAAALRQYEACQAILERELGLPPQDDTTILYRQIAQGDWPPGGAETAAPTSYRAASSVRRMTGATVRLPVQPTPFVGRQEETKAILNLLTDPNCRLLCLTGPGGSGKSRLAIRAAEQLVKQGHPAVADGAYFVALAPLTSPNSIGPAIGNSLGGDFYQEGEVPGRQLIDYLRQKRLLLVLDNFEHLLNRESVALLGDLMTELTELKLMVTSRIRLNIRGEQLYDVGGMKTPAPGLVDGFRGNGSSSAVAEAESYSAVRLFVRSAHRLRPGFELNEDNLESVVRICQVSGGMPLAIELAAGWVEVLTPDEIAAELESGLDFLATELHDVPERQRSVRTVFDSSWRLLDAREQAIMGVLSVFRGGFDRQAAAAISGATLRQLLSLTNKSWLRREAGGRYQIHELLRQYASERLGSDPEANQRADDNHADFYGEMLNEAAGRMKGPEQLAAFDQVAADLDNIRAAWLWRVEQRQFSSIIKQMLPGLMSFWLARSGGTEMLPLVSRARAALESTLDESLDSEELAIMLVYEARSSYLGFNWRPMRRKIQQAWSIVDRLGSFQRYEDWLVLLAESYTWEVDHIEGIGRLERLAETARRSRETWGEAFTGLVLAEYQSDMGENRTAVETLTPALAIFEKLEDVAMQAHARRRLGSLLVKIGEFDEAERILLSGRDLFRTLSNRAGETFILEELAELYLQTGQFTQAFFCFRERREIALAMDHRRLVAESLHWESMQAARFGDPEAAMAMRLQSIEYAGALGDQVRLAWSTWELGELLRLEGDFSAARRRYDDARILFEASDYPLGIGFYNRGLGDIALAAGDYETARDRFERFLQLAGPEAHFWGIAYALSGLGRVEVAQGNLDRARRLFQDSFKRSYGIGSRDLSMLALYGLAALLSAADEASQAVELAAFVAHNHLSWHETKRLATTLLAKSSQQLPEESAKATIERGRAHDLDTVIAEFGLEVKEAADG